MKSAARRMDRPPPLKALPGGRAAAGRWTPRSKPRAAGPAGLVTGDLAAPPRPIAVARVRGTRVFSSSGEPCGRIGDLSIEKRTGRIVYALVGEEGWFGSLERLRPVPWSLLRYDATKAGYVIPAEKADVFGGPDLSQTELRWLGAGDPWQIKLALAYEPYLATPFF